MRNRINVIGYRAGMAAFTATVAYVIAQLLQVAGILRFPYDEALIYGSSLCIVVPYLLEVLALHHLAEGEKRFWAHAALLFATAYAVFVTANYVVQLATVLPAKLRGGAEAIRLLEQTPHSLFWDFDAIGYVAMGLSSLFLIPAIGGTGFGRKARWALMANFLVTPLIAIVYFYPVFSVKLLFLGFPWAITAPLSMLMLALLLGKGEGDRGRESPSAPDHPQHALAEGFR